MTTRFSMSAFVLLNGVELSRFGSLEAEPVHAEPYANAIQISGKGAVLSKPPDFAESLQEGFLGNIFRFVTIAE